MKIADSGMFRTLAIDKYPESLSLAFSLTIVLIMTFVAIPGMQAQSLFHKAGTLPEDAPQSPQIYALPKSGPPTTIVLVQGAGFDPLTAIDISFDSVILASTTTDKNGAFGTGIVPARGATFVRLQVPATALPGQHTIMAQERVGQVSAQTAFLVQTDWAEFHFGADRAGVNPYENVLGVNNAGHLTQQWSFLLGGAGGASPVVVDGLAYVGGGSVRAVDVNTGTRVWNFAVTGVSFAQPAVADGLLYVGGFDGYVYAIDSKTGYRRWKYQTGAPVSSSPSIVNGTVYVGNGPLWALNATTGALLWQYSAGGIFSSPAVSDGVVYVASDDNYLDAVDASTGALIWQYKPQFGSFGNQSPVVAGGMVYVATDQDLYAVDAHTGGFVWELGGVSGGTPAVANGMVYVSEYSSGFEAVDATTGKLIWEYRNASTDWGSSPAVANGVLYIDGSDFFGDSKLNLFAFDANTGTLLGKYLGAIEYVSPVVVNGTVYTSFYGGYPKKEYLVALK